MKEFDNIEALETGVQLELENFLRSVIAPEVERILSEHIKNDIYGAYSPVMYKRRGLLLSGSNLESTVDGLELFVTDKTPGDTPIASGHTPSGTDLLKIIETGAQGHGAGKWPNAFPRPAVKNAQEEVDKRVNELLRAFFAKL